MDINTLKNLFEDFCNKNQLGGYTKFFSDYVEQAQLEVFDSIIGANIKNQTKGVVTVQSNNDNLINLKQAEFVGVDSNGFINVKALQNYRGFGSLRFPLQGKAGSEIKNYKTRVQILDDSEAWFYEEDSMYAPSYEYPIGTLQNSGIQVYPKNVQSTYLTYYRTPKKPIWASTYSAIYAEMENAVINNNATAGSQSQPLTGGVILGVVEANGGIVDKLEVIASGGGLAPISYLASPVLVAGANIGAVRITTRPVYDSFNSVQLEVSDALHNDILKIMLGYCGIKIRDAELYQESTQEINKLS